MKWQVLIDGRPVEIEREQLEQARQVEPGVYSLLIDGKSVEVRVVPREQGSTVVAGGRRFAAEVRDPRNASRGSRSALGGSRQKVVAPMPGKVIRVLVAKGDSVEPGQGLVVVEAMKMQNEMKASHAGHVVEVQRARRRYGRARATHWWFWNRFWDNGSCPSIPGARIEALQNRVRHDVVAERFGDARRTLDAYGRGTSQILAINQDGNRLIPLVASGCSSEEARALLSRQKALDLFPAARAPEAALGGLWLYFSCFDECHAIAQEIATPEGSFWHAIAHRQEPDPGNSAYWFRRVGPHPVFAGLREAASEIGARLGKAAFDPGARWDPFAFIEFSERARRRPGSEMERAALQIQRTEWQILFDYCARPGS